jgi:hypothetical protein
MSQVPVLVEEEPYSKDTKFDFGMDGSITIHAVLDKESVLQLTLPPEAVEGMFRTWLDWKAQSQRGRRRKS